MRGTGEPRVRATGHATRFPLVRGAAAPGVGYYSAMPLRNRQEWSRPPPGDIELVWAYSYAELRQIHAFARRRDGTSHDTWFAAHESDLTSSVRNWLARITPVASDFRQVTLEDAGWYATSLCAFRDELFPA